MTTRLTTRRLLGCAAAAAVLAGVGPSGPAAAPGPAASTSPRVAPLAPAVAPAPAAPDAGRAFRELTLRSRYAVAAV